MTQGRFSVTIDAPPESIWPWISQLEKHADWSPKAYSMEWTSGDPNTVGAQYRSVGWIPGDKNHVNTGEITEVTANRRFRLRAEDKEGAYDNLFTLEPSGDSTQVTFDLVFPKMKGMAALVVPVLFPLVGKPDIRKRMANLKATVEAERG